MATNENKIITQGGCNEISPSIEVFSGSLTKCPTKSEINATKKKIVLEAGVNSNRKNLTSSYIEKQLVVYPDVGHYVECTYNGAITDIPYIEFLYNNQIVESFYPFTEQGVTGGEKSFVLGLTYSFFEYDWSKMTIRASFGGKTNSLSSYKLNGYSGEKSSDGSYFVWNTTYANNILTGLINHTLEIFVDENKYGAELEITPSAGSIYVGDTTNFKVFYYTTTNGIRDNNGVDVTTSANWKSSSDSVATVSSGVVTGKNEGSVTISASYNGVSDNVPVGVSNYISITPTKLSFAAIGETKTVTVSATSVFSVSENLDWLSYTINGNTVSFTASENQTTSARNGSVTFSCGSKTVTLDVSQNAANVSYELEIQTIVNSIYVGDVINLMAIYHEYRNGKHYSSVDVSTKTNTIWETNDSNVATVSNGEVRGQSEGNAMISATYNGVSDSITIGVYNYISINPTTLVFVATGQSHNVTVTATSNFSVSENLDWLSYTINGNIVIFTASENKTTNVRRGTVTFTCGSESVEMSVSQNTASATYELVVTPSSDSVLVGGTVKFTATYYEYRNGAYYADADVTTTAEWETNDSSIATVSKGEVTGKDKGETTITASYNGASDSSTVSVYYPAPSLQVNPETIYFNQTGGNETFVVEAYNYSTITASRNNTWFTLSKLNGIGDYTVSVSSNPNSTQRTGSITITCVGLDGTQIERTVNVVQYASDIYYYLSVTPSTAAIDVGDTVALTATYYREINNNVESLGDVTTAATWATSSTSIATVSKGVVTGRGEGTTKITATYNGESDYSTVSVDYPSPSFNVTPKTIYIDATGGTGSFVVTASNYESITYDQNVSWFTLLRTDEVGECTVKANENPNGVRRIGSVTITCVGLDGSETEVTVDVIQYASVISDYLLVTPTSGSVMVGDTVNFSATYYYEINGSVDTTDVTSAAIWTTSSTSIATVSKGVVTGKDAGETKVTASYNGVSDSSTVSVYHPAPALTVTPLNIYIDETGGSASFTVSASNQASISASKSGSWFTLSKTSGTGAYTVSADENPYDSQRTGSVTITCIGLNGSELEETVYVTQYESIIGYYLSVFPSSETVNVGETVNLTATYYCTLNGNVTSEEPVTTKANWTPNPTGIATVSQGKVTGITGGTTTITAKYNGYSDYCSITVNDVYSYVYYISNYTSPINNGDTRDYNLFQETWKNGAYVQTNEITDGVIWTIDDTSIAFIGRGDGIVTGRTQGTTTIRASYVDPNGQTRTPSRELTVNKVEYSLIVEPSSITIEVGETYQLKATYYTITNGVSDGGVDVTSDATWGSGSATYVSVNGNGLVTGVKNTYGNTFNITATYNGISDKCGVIVIVVETVPVLTGITLNTNNISNTTGSYSVIRYVTAFYDNGTSGDVTTNCGFSIDNPNIASLDGTRIYHKEAGSTTLRVRYEENGVSKSTTCTVSTTLLEHSINSNWSTFDTNQGNSVVHQIGEFDLSPGTSRTAYIYVPPLYFHAEPNKTDSDAMNKTYVTIEMEGRSNVGDIISNTIIANTSLSNAVGNISIPTIRLEDASRKYSYSLTITTRYDGNYGGSDNQVTIEMQFADAFATYEFVN